MPAEILLEKQGVNTISIESEEVFSLKQFSDQATSFIEEGWNRVISARDGLISLPLLRVKEIDQTDRNITIKASADVYYKDVVGLRNFPGSLQRIKSEDAFMVISYMSVVTTSDGFTVLLERDSGDWEHSLEFPGGFVRVHEAEEDLHEIAKNGLYKDLKISSGDIAKVKFSRFFEFKAICETIFLFNAKLELSFEELQLKTGPIVFKMPDDHTLEEHDRFFELPFHLPSKDVYSFIKSEGHQL